MHSYTVISFYRVAAGATWVMSSIWWPFLGANGSSSPNLSEVGCFNSSQNTVLIGSEFEGVPIVLLLNFIAFLVGARKLRLFLWNTTKTSLVIGRVLTGSFFMSLPQILLSLFSIIRRNFWDYGRLALVADNEGSVQDFCHLRDHWRQGCGNDTSINYTHSINYFIDSFPNWTGLVNFYWHLFVWPSPELWTLYFRFTESTRRRYGRVSTTVDDPKYELVRQSWSHLKRPLLLTDALLDPSTCLENL